MRLAFAVTGSGISGLAHHAAIARSTRAASTIDFSTHIMIYKMFTIPAMTYGCETTIENDKHFDALDTLYTNQIHSLAHTRPTQHTQTPNNLRSRPQTYITPCTTPATPIYRQTTHTLKDMPST